MKAPQLALQQVDDALDDAARAALVFDGVVLVHRGVVAMRELVRLAGGIVREHFGEGDPRGAQQHLDRDRFLALAAAAQTRFGADETVRATFAAALAEAGVDTAEAAWDKRALRVLPSGSSHAGGSQSTVHVHRDTWGSNLYAQVNWWAPVFPTETGNSILFYPAFWRRPLANSSDRWRFEDYLAARRLEQGITTNDYPSAPMPLAAVSVADAVPVVVQPGDLLCFSAAHLHGGTDNRSGHVRFSIETRTLSLHDLAAGRAAPNIDGQGDTPRLGWFRHMRDAASLAGLVAAPLVPAREGRNAHR